MPFDEMRINNALVVTQLPMKRQSKLMTCLYRTDTDGSKTLARARIKLSHRNVNSGGGTKVARITLVGAAIQSRQAQKGPDT